MKLIFLGPPGAGKGTLAALVAGVYKIPHISTGEIFRAAIREKTPLGLRVQAIIDAGQLVSDDITVELVRERLAKKGHPRTVSSWTVSPEPFPRRKRWPESSRLMPPSISTSPTRTSFPAFPDGVYAGTAAKTTTSTT